MPTRGTWPGWGAMTRAAILNDLTHGREYGDGLRALLAGVTGQLASLQTIPPGGGDDARRILARQRLATIIDHLAGGEALLTDLSIVVGDVEVALHEVEECKPGGASWPRHSRPVYAGALILAQSSSSYLGEARLHIRELTGALERLERPGRASATAWLSTLPGMLAGALQARQRAYVATGNAQRDLTELANILLRARIEEEL